MQASFCQMPQWFQCFAWAHILHQCNYRLMGVELAVAVAGVLVPTAISATRALWKIANDDGQFKAKTSQILEEMKTILRDHEDRLREVERNMPH